MSGYELDMTENGEVIVKGSSSNWNPGGSTGGENQGGNTGSSTITLEKSSVGSNFIVVQANINNVEIEKIEYSLDDGDSWENGELSTIHTFNGLTKNTSYQIKARITSNGKTITSQAITISTKDITEPTYTTETTGSSKIVTITYPKINGQTLTYEYSIDRGSTWKTATQIQNVTFNVNGTIIARVTDGTNTVTANTLTINGVQAEEAEVLNGATPQLYSGLIPIKYENNNWVVADITEKWHDYANQEWANAVILKEGTTKNVGDTVNVSSEARAMFVWIPRYEYKISGTYGKGGSSADTPGEIEVNFIPKTQTTASSGYRVHPAFIFGTEHISGIWVGKFETTGTATAPTILPSVISLRNQTVNAQFQTSQIFNTYISDVKSDFHMAKNSEWGAAAYLSQSKYGKYGNPHYTSANKEVMINNNSNMITGIGANTKDEASTTSTTNKYETAKGQAASTTGNITGIYDMSGGASEHVMGVFNKTVKSSGISTWPNEKYYDNYTTVGLTAACNGKICYGQALSETQGWYGDASNFVNSNSPWLIRGGSSNSTSTAGVFNYSYNDGGVYGGSFRVVISGS